MEFPNTTKLYFSLMVVFVAATILLNPVFATNYKTCNFPAIFSFGASNADTGGSSASLSPLNPPYGDTYFHRPVGRYSDGRLIIDFIAQNFGLPYLSAYLDSLGTNFSHGANFATGGSTIRTPQIVSFQSRLSPFFLAIQFTQFREFIRRAKFIRNQGGVFATLMPKEEYFSEALYTFDIGQNDLSAAFFSNMTLQQINASIPDIVNTFTTNVKNIYNLGARSFWIHNTGPLGCLPIILTNFPFAERDSYGCATSFNDMAQYFNQKLKEALAQFHKDFPLASVIYVDIYTPKYSLFSNPNKYGFELPLVTCCGYGGKYNFNNNVGCGGTIVINGSNIFVGSCDRPNARVIWDGTHYTEAANKIIFDQISTGSFSEPPFPLNMACHRNLKNN